ncbi:MAG: exodeoxyribonuclease V subunit gamma, partial [Persicimonas sp.]
MLQVWYSNEVEALVDALVEAHDIERKRRRQSVFERTPLVVPNSQLEAYLKFAVAKRRGIAAHFAYHRTAQFFGTLLPDEGRFRLLDDETLLCLVIDALGDEDLLDSEDLAPARQYLQAAGGDPDARELRRFQLAEHVANLFQEYAFGRPQMVRSWPEQALFDDGRWGRVEAWQRALWLGILGDGGRLARIEEATGVEYVLLADLFERVPVDELELPPAVHFFSPGHLGRAFEAILGELGRHAQVHVWALNPCREFWEDVITDAEEESELLSSRAVDGGQLVVDGFEVVEADDEPFWQPEKFPAALKLWGRAGRDRVRMFNRLCGHDFNPLFREPLERADTALTRLQHDILHLNGETHRWNDPLEDDTVRFMSCPDVKREAEAIANEIWALVRGDRELPGDDPLSFNEIAVVVNHEQRAAYQTHLEAVFRDVHDIPFNLVDLETASTSRLMEAIELLLELPFGDFRRRELLRLLTHPNLIARFEEVDPERWLTWCDELSIVHGADHGDHADTYIDEDLFNWDQGLKRLVLGGFMTGEASGDRRAFEQRGFEYLPHEIDRDEAPGAARFVACARSLIAEARACRGEEKSLAEWVDHLGELLERTLAPADEREEFEWMRCRNILTSLADADATGEEVSY